ncbi:hypothetical protein SAMN06297144_3407 [Sphingomonas guangdongensis]|uniref:Uncharacterized protein n=1 Tax=Sphingomonas guangdongensis TaxID=1141890 RepID=A0A285R3F9_9SPHN|nr:hypothetical protein [Sphingomonas guangdongensis]SOB88259.1 hypothetical protein SAMN06297144_3407 [Sphingomonas guangdongensis]
MAAWLSQRRADVALRASGILLAWLGYLAFAELLDLHASTHRVILIDHALAAVSFVSVGSGGALLLLGRHLFDEVAVSARWRPCADPQLFSLDEGTSEIIDMKEGPLSVSRSPDGGWIVRDSGRVPRGRFQSVRAVHEFVQERCDADSTPTDGRAERLHGRLTLSTKQSDRSGGSRG